MIRCGGAALWSVVKNGPVGTEISHEPKTDFEVTRDGLSMMFQTADRVMKGEDRCRVAEDQEPVAIENGLLAFGEILDTEETWSLPDACFINPSKAACRPSGIVLQRDRERGALDAPCTGAFEG